VSLNEHELSEIRMLIEERTSIRFDESRERFFSTRVREHMVRKGHARGIDLLRAIKKTNFDFQELLESLLTRKPRSFRYPGVFEAFEKARSTRNSTLESSGRIRGRFAFGVPVVPLGKKPYSHRNYRLATLFSFSEAWNVESSLRTSARHALTIAERGVYSGRRHRKRRRKAVLSHSFSSPRKAVNRFVSVFAKMVNFVQMNLSNSVYVGKMDVIFCMNVLIYFSERASPRTRSEFLLSPRAGRLSLSRPLGVHLKNAGEVSGHRFERLHFVSQADCRRGPEG